MEFRETIENKLKEIDKNIYYGLVSSNQLNSEWNYIVFGKARIRPDEQRKVDVKNQYWVTIVRENYIPDEIVYDVISKLNSISGLHFISDGGDYDYIFKNNTDMVIELVTLKFARVEKGVNE